MLLEIKEKLMNVYLYHLQGDEIKIKQTVISKWEFICIKEYPTQCLEQTLRRKGIIEKWIVIDGKV